MAAEGTQIVIRGLTGQELAVIPALYSQSILDVKKAICNARGVAVGKQRLLAGTTVLKNQDRLEEALPQAESVELTLILTDKWPEEVAQDWRRLRKAPEGLRNDPELVMQAIAASKGEALKYAGEAARADREIALEAMQHDVSTVRFAGESLREDVTFLLAAGSLLVNSPHYLISRAGVHKWGWERVPALCADCNFVLAMAKAAGGLALRAAAPPLLKNKEVVAAAVNNSGLALQFAAEELRGDPEVVRQAVQQSPDALQYASVALKADRELALLAIERAHVRQCQRGELVLGYMGPELQGDWTVVSLAVQQCALNLMHASPELKCDLEMIHLAADAARAQGIFWIANGDAFMVPGVLELLQADWRKFEFLPSEMQQRREVAVAALKSRGGVPTRKITRMTLSAMVEKLVGLDDLDA